MIKYASLQFKRVAKRLIAFICFMAVIAIVAVAAVSVAARADSDKTARIRVAITGDNDSKYLNLGILAATSLDSSRFSMELVKLSQTEAQKQLQNGTLSAYVILPDGFIKKAESGQIADIEIVTSLGDEGVTTLFKNEITAIITDIYASAQSGVYGVADAMTADGQGKTATKTMNKLLDQYLNIILKRSELYTFREYGFSDGFSQTEYYIGAAAALFLMISAMPFCTLFVNTDMSLCRLMHSRGTGVIKQLLCEMAAFCLPFFALSLAVGGFTKLSFVSLIPPVLLVCTMSFFVWELPGGIISALLCHFFVTAVMGFCSGCFYPISSLPLSMQSIGRALPTGVIARYISGLSIGYSDGGTLLLYCAFFFVLCAAVRTFKRRCAV